MLATLGAMPALGRNFQGSGSARRDMSAIVSHRVWVAAFERDPAAVGRSINVNGASYTVIGVLPATFQFPRSDASYFTEDVGLLIPVANIAASWGRDSPQWFAIGRLATETTISQAQAEMDTLSARMAGEHLQQPAVSIRVSPLHAETTSHVRPALMLMMGIAIVLLLVACTNITSLLFSRSVVRGREIAIRKAVGANTGRLVRQMLTESACLTLLAGIAGVLVARLALDGLVRLSPFHLPVSGTVRIDPAVLAFTFATCAAATIIAGLFPALHAAGRREDLLGGSGTRTAGGQRVAHVQRALTVAQVALGLALLTTAGLLVHSLWRLSAVDPGFRREGVFGFSLTVPSNHPPAQTTMLYARMLDAVRTIPGVTSAGWTTWLPPEPRKGVFIPFSIEGRPPAATPADRIFCNLQVTSEDYFSTVGIPLVRGRAFTAADDDSAPQVALVNETLARRNFPDEDPIGRRITTMFDPRPREIVGIVKTIHDRGLATNTLATAYVPFRQFSLAYGSIAVRAQIPPDMIVPEIRRRIGAIDASVPLTDFQTLDARLYNSLDEPRFFTVMASACALMAVLFVTLGLYGVVAHAVARRTAEIGIRIALGAQGGAILRMILRQGVGLVATGPRDRHAALDLHNQDICQPAVRGDADRSSDLRRGGRDHRGGDARGQLRARPPCEPRQPDRGAARRIGRLTDARGPPSVDLPGLRNVQLLEETDRIAIGHAGDEVARGGVDPFGFDGHGIEELFGSLVHFLPEAAEDTDRLSELGRRDRVFVHRVEQEASAAPALRSGSAGSYEFPQARRPASR